jgi:uncharacterized protein (DUF2141 family)
LIRFQQEASMSGKAWRTGIGMVSLHFALVLAAATPVFGQTGSLEVSVHAGEAGNVHVSVVTESEFRDLSELSREIIVPARDVAAAGGVIRVRFDTLPAGSYAATSYQDTNDNGVLDTGFAGRPKEPWDMSFTDERPSLRPPRFDDVRFDPATTPLVELTLRR